jgi:hypothetical protein
MKNELIRDEITVLKQTTAKKSPRNQKIKKAQIHMKKETKEPSERANNCKEENIKGNKNESIIKLINSNVDINNQFFANKDINYGS